VEWKKKFHQDVDWTRVKNHIPHGIMIALLSATIIFSKVAERFTEVFIRYEENEDKHTKDQAWNDYLGVLIGMAVVCTALLVSVIVVCLLIWRCY